MEWRLDDGQMCCLFLCLTALACWSAGCATITKPEDHAQVLYRQFEAGCAAFTRNHDWTRKDDILREPDTTAHPYAVQYVTALAELGALGELDEECNSGNAWASFSYGLIRHVIPSCPADKLDAECAYWESFWREHKQQIEHPRTGPGPSVECATRPLPWGVVAAAFAARKKDVQGVRQAFRQVASEIPREDINVWGGQRGNQSFEQLVPLYLKAAGDPDWDTWVPFP